MKSPLKIAIALALAATLPLASHAQTRPAATTHYAVNRGNPVLRNHGRYVDQLVGDFMTKNHLPGLTMAIVQAPYIPRSAGYGLISTTNDELASTKTMWNIGPITQGFTAVAVFQLYEDNKLDIHDPIDRYVPNLPPAWKKVTLFQLLQHASGIPDFRSSGGYDESKSYRPTELLALVKGKHVRFKRGTQVGMSATDFILLGLAIEKASGMSYHDYITRYQIEPLDLHSTMFASDFATRARLDRPPPQPGVNQHVRFKSQADFINPVEPATGYREVDGQLAAVDPRASENLYAFGALWASAEDISKWDTGLAGSVLVKRAADRDLIYKPTRLDNGTVVPAMAGWEFTHHPGFMEVKGSSPGFSSYLSRFTASSELVCVTLLTDKEGVDLTDLARDIAEAYKAGLGTEVDTAQFITQESKFSLEQTVAHLKGKEASERARSIQVMAARDSDAGVKSMLADPSNAVSRIVAWQDGRGRVWVSYRNPEQGGSAASPKAIEREQALDDLVNSAVNVYQY